MSHLSLVPDSDTAVLLTRYGLPAILTVAEVAALLRMDPKVIRIWCHPGRPLDAAFQVTRRGKWLIPTALFLTKPGATAIATVLARLQEDRRDRNAA